MDIYDQIYMSLLLAYSITKDKGGQIRCGYA